jgi:RNA polymerase sigma-70 factor (ECF subfamily)
MVETTAGQNLGFSSGKQCAQVYKDALLAERLRQGENAAFEELLETYQDPVFNLVFRLINHQSDAQDITQDVFLKVYKNLGRFEGKSTLKTWIYRIAINESYNHRRWSFRHRRGEVSLTVDEDHQSVADVLPDNCRSPFQLALDSETRALIEDALGRINPLFRAAVVLRDIEDLSYEEIAEVLETNIGTVKSRILRGRDALRRELEAKVSPADAFSWSAQTATGQ